MAITKIDLAHAEGDFISQIADLKKRLNALERQAIKVDENDFTLPVGGISVKNGFLTLGVPDEIDIDAGRIWVSKSYVYVNTEALAAADNLDFIYMVPDDDTKSPPDGTLLVLQAADTTNTVTLRDQTGIGGVGNLQLTVATRVLDSDADTIMLIFNAVLNEWNQLSYASNA